MGDDSSGVLESKSLSNLRVVDLKMELEKRGLSKSGSKKELVKRLKQKLELEKLYEESSAIGDAEPKLQLDEATEQNEFVKQYLAEQQKIYARQKEVKRLIELREMGKLEEEETDSDATNKDQDSDVSESLNTTKNSCDSSTHGDSAEPKLKEEKPSTYVASTGDPEPSSTVEDDSSERKDDPDHLESRSSESSNADSNMESINPKSVAYSLADIQLPENASHALKIKLSECNTPCSPESTTVQVQINDNKVAGSIKENINGTSQVDVTDCVQKVSSKSPETETNISSEPISTEVIKTDEDDISSQQESKEDLKEKQDKTQEAEEKVEEMDVSESPNSSAVSNKLLTRDSKQEDKEEGETDDTESEEEDAPESKEKTTELSAQEDSRDSTKSESSSSDSNHKRSRSSSSDSSSSHESIPKRKSYSKSSKPSDSQEHENDHNSVKEDASAVKEPSQPRRIKIKRTTNIITPEPEVKVQVPKSKHKKIEIEKVEDSKPVKQPAEKVALLPKVPVVETPPVKNPEVEAPPVETKPVKVTYRKLNVPFRKSDDGKDKSEKKRSWHSAALTKTSVSISTDSLKSIIPDFKVVCSPPVLNETEEVSVKSLDSNNDKDSVVKTVVQLPKIKTEEVQDEGAIIAPTAKKARRDSLKEVPPLEPMEIDKVLKTESEKPQSKIIFVQNLVRPFTLLQLKDVLKQTGTLVEEGFWIDKIKSKCFVTYETEEQAMKTREALHNCRWPASNPKILSVQFSTQEEFDSYKNDVAKPLSLPPAPSTSSEHKGNVVPISAVPKKRERDDSPKERERQRHTAAYIREWDKDKLTQESPDREQKKEERRHSPRRRDRSKSADRRERKKGSSKTSREAAHAEKKDVQKKPAEEETPAKLLDDLFQKTKATPCIYWLPLTEEQMKLKEDQRKARRLEREKRNQEQEEAERQARRKPRGKDSRSRSRSPVRRR